MESKRLNTATWESNDFVAHMELVLDVYKAPYNKDYPVVCMDESPKQGSKKAYFRQQFWFL